MEVEMVHLLLKNRNGRKISMLWFSLIVQQNIVSMRIKGITESLIMVLKRFIHGSNCVKSKVTTDCKLPLAQMQVIFIRLFVVL